MYQVVCYVFARYFQVNRLKWPNKDCLFVMKLFHIPLYTGFLVLGTCLIPAWISNDVLYTVLYETTYPFQTSTLQTSIIECGVKLIIHSQTPTVLPNFNGCIGKVGKCTSNIFPHLIGHAIIYPCLGWSSFPEEVIPRKWFRGSD